MAQVITVADCREEMLDRVAEDHLVIADLAFTDEDIVWAMKACAREFNSLQPYTLCAIWDCLPYDTSVFFDGVVWALYRRWHRNVSINDYDYSAGGVTANVQGSLRKNLEKLKDEAYNRFFTRATELKVHKNLNDVYGPLG